MRTFLRAMVLAIGVLAVASAAQAACKLGTFTDENTYSLPGCPADAKEMVTRMYACFHWEGEEPYDKARGEEIAAAVKSLRCDSYLADYRALQEKYRKNPSVSHVLQKAFPIQE